MSRNVGLPSLTRRWQKSSQPLTKREPNLLFLFVFIAHDKYKRAAKDLHFTMLYQRYNLKQNFKNSKILLLLSSVTTRLSLTVPPSPDATTRSLRVPHHRRESRASQHMARILNAIYIPILLKLSNCTYIIHHTHIY